MTSVVTSQMDGSLAVPLAALGRVGSVQFSHAWPGGCQGASCTLDVPADYDHWALNLGRRFSVYLGTLRVWTGVLTDPLRGSPWQLSADGLQSLAAQYEAVDSTGQLTTIPNTAVDQAIARGLPWLRAESLPTSTVTPSGSMLSDLLNAVSLATGQRWGVGAGRHITMPADPTSAFYVIHAADTPGSRTLDGYATTIYGSYNDTTSGTVKLTSVSVGNQPWGTYETTPVDLTGLAAMSGAAAQNILKGMLPLVTARAFTTGTWTVGHGQIRTLGGQPVALPTVRAGRMVQLRGVAPDPSMGELNYTTSVNVVIGQTSYDADAHTLQVAPVGYDPLDFTSYLARLQPAAATG